MSQTRNWTVAAGVTLIHIVIALVHGGPVAVPDVSAYLSVAQWPYGGVLPVELAFHPGYGALLIPVGWLDGDSLHTAALILNGLLAGICVWLSGCLAKTMSPAPWVWTSASIAAAFHPSLSVSSRIGWSETLLVAVLLAAGILAARGHWAVFGTVCGIAVVIHPRMIVVTIAALVVSVAIRKTLPVLKGLVPAILVSAAGLYFTNSWPSARLDAAISPDDVTGPVGTIAGQFLALSGGTAGLAVLGLLLGIALIRNPTANPAGLFFAISGIGIIFMGGWVLAGSDRVDTLLYSRYAAPWAIPLMILVLATLSTQTISRRAIYISLSFVFAALVFVLAKSHLVDGSPRTIMTLDISALWSLANGRLGTTALAAVAVSSLSIVTVKKTPAVALLLLACVAIPSLLIAHQNLHKVGQIADGQAATSELVPDYVGCLAHDRSTKSYAMWLYRLELPDIDHRRIDLASGQQPCGPYVVAERTALDGCSGAQLVGVEPRANWGLWEYPAQGCG
ncbi:MAG: hypothetical protein CMB31_06050 [Euryarchaeota archaeon]|nr:hypothetical protein [Euryarchaeota archaeon]